MSYYNYNAFLARKPPVLLVLTVPLNLFLDSLFKKIYYYSAENQKLPSFFHLEILHGECEIMSIE